MIQSDDRIAGSSFHGSASGATAKAAVVARLLQSDLFREYQQAFEVTTGLPLMLRQAGSFRTPLQGSLRVNPFCALMTQTNRTCAACLQLQQRLEDEATLAAKTRQCHAGLSETAVPVRVGDTVLGYLQTGQVFLQPPSRKRFEDFTRQLPGASALAGQRRLKAAYFQTRVLTRKQYDAIVRLLVIFAEHLAAVSNRMLIGEATTQSPMIGRARTYIAEHQTEQLHLGDAARAMNMSLFHFCKAFKKATELGFTEYLARARVEAVKEMLLDRHLRVSEAAYAAGFQSLSQFNRIFHRVTGEPPSVYRARLHGLKAKPIRPAVLVPAA